MCYYRWFVQAQSSELHKKFPRSFCDVVRLGGVFWSGELPREVEMLLGLVIKRTEAAFLKGSPLGEHKDLFIICS